MGTNQQNERGVYLYIIAILITIVGFFAGAFYTDVKELKRTVDQNSIQILIIKNKIDKL